MNTPPETPALPAEDEILIRQTAAGWCVLWLTMLVYGALTSPIPAVNEPHYLGKAKHFWDRSWCPGDLLMESSNAHAVFYAVVGASSRWLTLPQLAVFGRGVGYAVLAWGWWRSQRALSLSPWLSWWSLAGFLTLGSWGNFSGEWIIGGIEGKVFSYGFLLLAFADWQEKRPLLAALWAGLAISFHPVAGGWGVLAAVLAEFAGPRSGKRSCKSMIKAGVVMLIAALPGLIPAMHLVIGNDSEKIRIDGTYLQVYYRLAHHLDPMTFPWRSWTCYGAMLLMVVFCRRQWTSTAAGRMWLRVVCWAGVFALAGFLAGWGPRPPKLMPLYLVRMNFLKFYPFRLFDVMLPVTVAMQWTMLVARPFSVLTDMRKPLVGVLAAATFFAMMAGGEWRRHQLRKPTVFDTPEWIDVCRWIRSNTPTDALIQTPVRNQNFKWFAERAEYVSYKDVPQDNRSLVEWNRRMLFLNRWYHDHRADGIYSNDELRSLRAEIGITHILTDRLGPFELSPSYTNDVFRVYDLTTLEESP